MSRPGLMKLSARRRFEPVLDRVSDIDRVTIEAHGVIVEVTASDTLVHVVVIPDHPEPPGGRLLLGGLSIDTGRFRLSAALDKKALDT